MILCDQFVSRPRSCTFDHLFDRNINLFLRPRNSQLGVFIGYVCKICAPALCIIQIALLMAPCYHLTYRV